MLIGEPVDVELSPNGAPVRFVWRGSTYGIISTPEPWLARETWWRTASRAARGSNTPIEREMWRVDAVPLRGMLQPGDTSFDLCRQRDGGWLLEQAWSGELDERLFA